MKKADIRLCRTRIYKDAMALPPDWDEALPEGHALRTEALHLHEAAGFEDVQPLYVLLTDVQGAVIALAAFQVLHLKSRHVNTEKLRPWQQQAWNVFRKISRPRLLVGGHLFRHDAPSLFVPEKTTPFQAFKAYRQAIRTAARKSGADAVLLKDPPAELHAHFLHFAPKYRMMPGDISMELALPAEWQTLGDYEKALKHKYAQRMRNIRKAGSNLRMEPMDVAAVQFHAPRLYELYEQVALHQPVRLGLISPQYLPLLKQHFPETFRIWGFFEGDTLVAFASAWLRGPALDMFYIGFDYARNRDLQLYFNILFHAVSEGVELRRSKIIFGRTALEAKARIGARAVYLHTFLYIRNPIARALVDRMQAALSDTDGDWESRHPFK